MRTIFISIVTLVLLLEASLAPAAEPVKLKHVATYYADNNQISFNLPEGIACNNDSFVVADTGNSRVVRYSLQAQTFVVDGVFPVPQAYPIVAQMNSKGDIYLLDGKERRIIKLNRSGEVQGKVAPKNLAPPANFVPRSFAIDNKDRIYLLDIFSERVIVLNGDEQYERQIAFPEKYGFFSDLAVTPQGVVYLVDSVEAVVYRAAPDAEGFEPLTGNMKEFMNFPKSIALDNSGGLFLSDQYGSGLVLVGRDGSFLGRKLSLGWVDSQLYYPAQICVNEQNSLFIADRNNSRVQLFSIVQ